MIGGRGTDVADFPLFDHFGSRYYNIYDYTFSYIRFAFFPWTLDGQSTLVPLAGFTVDPQPSGLNSLEVTTGKAAVAREGGGGDNAAMPGRR